MTKNILCHVFCLCVKNNNLHDKTNFTCQKSQTTNKFIQH